MKINSNTTPYRSSGVSNAGDLSTHTDETPRTGSPAYEVTLSREGLNAQSSVMPETAATETDIDKTTPVEGISTLHEDSGSSVSVKHEAGIRVLKMALEQQAEVISILV